MVCQVHLTSTYLLLKFLMIWSEISIDRWKDSDRRKLSEEGYRTLAILVSRLSIFYFTKVHVCLLPVRKATFMAAVQSQLLTSSFVGGDSTSSQAVTTLFICGLFADLLGAVLNYGSARWFEMLTPSEAKYLQQCWVAAEAGKGLPSEHPPEFIDRWVSVSIKMGYYASISGLILLVAGLLVWVWTQHLQLVFRIIPTVLCVFFAAFIPPFARRHNRLAALHLVRLRRRSG
jgi:hypothetical protein